MRKRSIISMRSPDESLRLNIHCAAAMCLDNIYHWTVRIVWNDSNYKHSQPQEKAIKPRGWIKTLPIIESAYSTYRIGKFKHCHTKRRHMFILIIVDSWRKQMMQRMQQYYISNDIICLPINYSHFQPSWTCVFSLLKKIYCYNKACLLNQSFLGLFCILIINIIINIIIINFIILSYKIRRLYFQDRILKMCPLLLFVFESNKFSIKWNFV